MRKTNLVEEVKIEKEEEEEVLVDCGTAHYWVIDLAEGPKSQGTCQKCGQTKRFSNSIESKAYTG